MCGSPRLYMLILMVLVLLGAERAAAQRVENTDIAVSARNRGGFECAAQATFDFGSVDPTGTDYGTANVIATGRNAANTGSVYENQPGSVRWRCRAWPPGFVTIALNSTATDHSGGMDPNDLEVRLRARGLFGIGSSTGWQTFTSQANLMTGVLMGSGFFSVGGVADLRLTVLDVDPPGPNTWIVQFRATAFP